VRRAGHRPVVPALLAQEAAAQIGALQRLARPADRVASEASIRAAEIDRCGDLALSRLRVDGHRGAIAFHDRAVNRRPPHLARVRPAWEPGRMQPPQFYAGLELDRATHLRRDAAWVEERLRDAATRLLPVWRSQHLVRMGSACEPLVLSPAEGAALVAAREELV